MSKSTNCHDKLYYKVVEVLPDGTLRSCVANDDDSIVIEYKLGEWTFPKIKGSKIFIFDNLHDTKDFCDIVRNNGFYCQIFTCKATGVSKSAPFVHYSIGSELNQTSNTIKEVWKKYRNKQAYKYLMDLWWSAPDGTKWADAVKLLERVS